MGENLMKKSFLLFLLLFVMFGLQGCGSDHGNSTPPAVDDGTDPENPTPPVTPPATDTDTDTVISPASLGDLEDLGDYLNAEGEGWFFTSTIDVNSAGQIIGESPGNNLIFWDPASPDLLTGISIPFGGFYDDYFMQTPEGGSNPFVAFEAIKINDAGQVIGNRYANEQEVRAFIWNSADDSTIDLSPPNFINDQDKREFGLNSRVVDINEEGAVVLTADHRDGSQRAYYWDGSTYETIDDLVNSDDSPVTSFDVPLLVEIPSILRSTGAEAVGLNDIQQVVTSSSDQGVYYDLAIDGWAALGTLNGAPSSIPVAINNNKRIVGMSGNEGFFWAGGVMYPISNPNGAAIEVVGVNNNNIVIGNSGGQAFVWQIDPATGKGVFKSLGTLGGATSTAVDINDRDEIVGYATTGAQYEEGNIVANVVHGFLWKDNVMYDLGAHAPPNYEYPFNPDFYSSRAKAISQSGIVTGISYSINDHARGFTLTPVFP